MTYNDIYKELTKDLTGTPLNNFLLLDNKDAGYTTASYYLKHNQKQIINQTTWHAYKTYLQWCSENNIPSLTSNKFTRLLKGHQILIQQTRRNNEIVRIYTKLDHCPTCLRSF
jgi:hypothetical protein